MARQCNELSVAQLGILSRAGQRCRDLRGLGAWAGGLRAGAGSWLRYRRDVSLGQEILEGVLQGEAPIHLILGPDHHPDELRQAVATGGAKIERPDIEQRLSHRKDQYLPWHDLAP